MEHVNLIGIILTSANPWLLRIRVVIPCTKIMLQKTRGSDSNLLLKRRRKKFKKLLLNLTKIWTKSAQPFKNSKLHSKKQPDWQLEHLLASSLVASASVSWSLFSSFGAFSANNSILRSLSTVVRGGHSRRKRRARESEGTQVTVSRVRVDMKAPMMKKIKENARSRKSLKNRNKLLFTIELEVKFEWNSNK